MLQHDHCDAGLGAFPCAKVRHERTTRDRTSGWSTRDAIADYNYSHAFVCVCVEVSAVVNGPRFGHVVCVCHGLLPGKNEEREREKKFTRYANLAVTRW